MLMNLLFGLPTMVICLLLQSCLLGLAIRFYANHLGQAKSDTFKATLLILSGVMLLLVIGNLAQVVIWALLFRGLGEFSQLGESIYHSAVNFATLGYGDIVMSDQNKFLGPLEAINGALMIGVSTAALMAAFQHSLARTIQERRQAAKQ